MNRLIVFTLMMLTAGACASPTWAANPIPTSAPGQDLPPSTEAGCPWSVDITAGQAVHLERTVHKTSKGVEISACVRQANARRQPLVKDGSVCRVEVIGDQALETSRLVYKTDDGRLAEAAPCNHRPDDAAWPVISISSGCALRHRWDLHRSEIWVRKGYWTVAGGQKVFHQIMGCLPSSAEPLPHHEAACDSLSLPGTRVGDVPRLSVEVQMGNKTQTILACRPRPDIQGITYDSSACDGSSPERRKYFHDLDGGMSLGAHRVLIQGELVTNCIPDPETIYAVTDTRIGWQNDDDSLSARPVLRKELAGAPDAQVIGKPFVGDRAYPYILQGTKEVESRHTRFLCANYPVKDVVALWKRPDGSIFENYLREADPAGAGACK